LTEHYRLFCS